MKLSGAWHRGQEGPPRAPRLFTGTCRSPAPTPGVALQGWARVSRGGRGTLGTGPLLGAGAPCLLGVSPRSRPHPPPSLPHACLSRLLRKCNLSQSHFQLLRCSVLSPRGNNGPVFPPGNVWGFPAPKARKRGSGAKCCRGGGEPTASIDPGLARAPPAPRASVARECARGCEKGCGGRAREHV